MGWPYHSRPMSLDHGTYGSFLRALGVPPNQPFISIYLGFYMKSSILMGFSMIKSIYYRIFHYKPSYTGFSTINHPALGVPQRMETSIQCLLRARMAYVAWKGSKSSASDHPLSWTRKRSKHHGPPQLSWKVWFRIHPIYAFRFVSWVMGVPPVIIGRWIFPLKALGDAHFGKPPFVCSPLKCFFQFFSRENLKDRPGPPIRSGIATSSWRPWALIQWTPSENHGCLIVVGEGIVLAVINGDEP